MKLTNILKNYVVVPVVVIGLMGCETLQRRDANAEAITATTIYQKAHNLKDGTTQIGANQIKYSPKTLDTMYKNQVYQLPQFMAVKYNLCKEDDCRIKLIKEGLEKEGITQSGLEYEVLKYIQASVGQDKRFWENGLYMREAGRAATLAVLIGLMSGSEAAAAANQTKQQATGTVGAGSTNNVGSSVLRGVVTPVGPTPLPWRP